MSYSFKPKEPHAKVHGTGLGISMKNAFIICSVIRKKPLTRVKRLLDDLESERRSLRGKYYTNAVKEIKQLIASCEKNAEYMGMDKNRLMVHASAREGFRRSRRRRKAAFGSQIKSTHVEIMLIERGKHKEKKKETKDKSEKKEKPVHSKKEKHMHIETEAGKKEAKEEEHMAGHRKKEEHDDV